MIQQKHTVMIMTRNDDGEARENRNEGGNFKKLLSEVKEEEEINRMTSITCGRQGTTLQHWRQERKIKDLLSDSADDTEQVVADNHLVESPP